MVGVRGLCVAGGSWQRIRHVRPWNAASGSPFERTNTTSRHIGQRQRRCFSHDIYKLLQKLLLSDTQRVNGPNGTTDPHSSISSPAHRINGERSTQSGDLDKKEFRASTKARNVGPTPNDKVSILPPDKRYAMLVDGDNASREQMTCLLNFLSPNSTPMGLSAPLYSATSNITDTITNHTLNPNIIVRRVYGDFNQPSFNGENGWTDFCASYSFTPIHCFSHGNFGKTSTDMSMIMEAMELLFTNPSIDGFLLVTSDSDFCRLANRLREADKHVIGCGRRNSASDVFVQSCQDFIFVDRLFAREQNHSLNASRSEQDESTNNQSDGVHEKPLAQSVVTIAADENERTREMSENVGLARQILDHLHAVCSQKINQVLGKVIDYRDLGYSKLSDMQLDCPKEFEEKFTSLRTSKKRLPPAILDRLHEECKRKANNEGFVYSGVFRSPEKLVEYTEFGYEKLSDMLLDYPNDFEVRGNKCRSIRNHNVQREQVKAIHQSVKRLQDKDGWAAFCTVADRHKDIQLSSLGYKRLADMIKDMPSEFQFKVEKTTAKVKSLL